MVRQEHPRVWRIQSPESNKVTESHCLGCSAFVGASQSLANFRLVELLHRARCKEQPKERLHPNSSPRVFNHTQVFLTLSRSAQHRRVHQYVQAEEAA